MVLIHPRSWSVCSRVSIHHRTTRELLAAFDAQWEQQAIINSDRKNRNISMSWWNDEHFEHGTGVRVVFVARPVHRLILDVHDRVTDRIRSDVIAEWVQTR